MIWLAMEHILMFLECFLFVEFVTRYNGVDWMRRSNRVAFLITLLLSFTIVEITNVQIESIQARLLIRTSILFLYAMYFLDGTQIGKILSCLFFPLILMNAQVFSGIFLTAVSGRITLQQLWTDRGWHHVLYQTLLLLLVFYSTRVFLRFRGSYRHPYRKVHILLSLVIPLITLLFAGFMVEMIKDGSMERSALIIMSLVMIAIIFVNLVIYYLLSSIGNEGDLVMENDMLRRYLQYEQRNMDDQKRIYEQIRAIRHELRNHLTLVRQQIEGGHTDEALAYIDDFQGRIYSLSNFVQTDNETLNFILNTHLSKAASLGIATKVRIEETRIPCKDIDLHSLLGNMLSNAIESLDASNGPKDLQVEITRQGGYISVLVRNRIETSVLDVNPHLVTTKEDVAQHGFGVRIIQAVARKYNGFVDYYEKEGFFCVQVLIPAQEEEKEFDGNE